MKTESEDETLGVFWPGVADSLLAALMIVLLLAFSGLVLFALNPNSSAAQLMQLRRAHAALQEKYAASVAENKKLQETIDQLKKEKPPAEPPIIELTDAQNVNFESGKAQISPEFQTRLREHEFPKLRQIIDEHPTVDTIEIIGHTDDARISSTQSNLDTKLDQVLAGSALAKELTAGSNADLGLMRAVAVKEAWRQWITERGVVLPRPIEIRCYSAANAVPPLGTASLPKKIRDQKARRIEIRFTQLNKTVLDQ